MKKLSTLKKGLVAAGLVACALGATAGTAFASSPQAPQAPKTAFLGNLTTFGFTPVGTPTAHDWVSNVLDPTSGNVTTTIHIQGAVPNSSYLVAGYDQSGDSFLPYPTITTNPAGNVDVTLVNSDPTITAASVDVIGVPTFSANNTFETPMVPVTVAS